MAKQLKAVIEAPGGVRIRLKADRKSLAKIMRLFVSSGAAGSASSTNGAAAGHELTGVAEVDRRGIVQITAPDLRARNAMDAATRLIYVGLLARRVLLEETKSPRGSVIALLRSHKLYDGNTRRIIPNDGALVKEGRQSIELSPAGVAKAWTFVREMRNGASES